MENLGIEYDVFIASMKACPSELIVLAQERAILTAYSDWVEMHDAQGRELSAEPVSKEKARMAQVDYEVKMADL